MNNSKFIVSLCVYAIGTTFIGAPACAQLNTSSPTAVKEVSPKPIWLKAEVIHADANSIIVREQADERMVHTFSYSPEIKDAMQKLFDAGGYQYGDKVRILYRQGQTVALKVRGKSSKPPTAPIPRPHPA
jgi:hypothetical protein